MKKFLTLLLAAAMLLCLAACGGERSDGDDSTDSAPAGGRAESSAMQENTLEADGTNLSGDAEPQTDSAAATGDLQPDATSAAAAAAALGLNSSDPAAVARFYVAARKATSDFEGSKTMKLAGDITGDGFLGTIISLLSGSIDSLLQKNSSAVDRVPGADSSDLRGSDISSASAKTVSGKYTDIVIYLKDQTDGPDGNPKNGGPVSRGVGTFKSIDGAINEMGGSITEGRDTFTMTYTDAYIKCRIDNTTGKIVGGTWHYIVSIFAGDVKGKIKGVTLTLKNVSVPVDFCVTA